MHIAGEVDDMPQVKIREMALTDCDVISSAFRLQGWNKPSTQYESYFAQQCEGNRTVLIAEIDTAFAGYVTVSWKSDYDPFRTKGIPEITDLNVLIRFRKRGVATALLDEAESRIMSRSQTAGIAVGLTADYGVAQRLYIRRGYCPDGLGISQNGRFLRWGDTATVDDGLVLHFVKEL